MWKLLLFPSLEDDSSLVISMLNATSVNDQGDPPAFSTISGMKNNIAIPSNIPFVKACIYMCWLCDALKLSLIHI